MALAAFVLALIVWVFVVGVVVLVWRFWRGVQPQVKGLAAMLGLMPPAETDGGDD